METMMKNAVPLSTVANTFNFSTDQLMHLIAVMDLDLAIIQNTAFVNISEFEFLSVGDDMLQYECL
jgi:hypothetical protein